VPSVEARDDRSLSGHPCRFVSFAALVDGEGARWSRSTITSFFEKAERAFISVVVNTCFDAEVQDSEFPQPVEKIHRRDSFR
jgi:hypothetical protein